MRTRALLATGLLALSTLVLSQGRFSYVDRAQSFSAQASGGKIAQVGSVYRLTLAGGVVVDAKSQGLRMSAGRITLDAAATKGNTQRNELRTATATSNLTLVKTNAGGQVTLKGSRGDYANRGSEGVVRVAGPVSLTNVSTAKKQSLSTAGASGVIVLASDPKAPNPLKTATLSGSVRVVLNQADGSKLIGTGSKLVIDNTAKPPTATLTGSVTIRGEGDSSLGTIQNVAKAVLTLNDKGEVVSFEVG